MDGLVLSAKYSLIPNSLGYCGPKGAHRVLSEYVEGRGNKKQAEEKLAGFEAENPYLRLIAHENKKKLYAPQVVEAYWIGGKLVEKVGILKTREMVKNDFAKYVYPEIAQRLSEKLPQGFLPFHNAHVLFLFPITQKIRKTTENQNNCLVSPAKITSVSENHIRAEITVLEKKGAETVFSKKVEKTFTKGFLEKPTEKDHVTIHWGTPVQKISKAQADRLSQLTRSHVRLLNKAREKK